MGEHIAVVGDGRRGALLAGALLLSLLATLMVPREARAQPSPPGCSPAVARVVSLQGGVEIQRADSGTWTALTRLDTALCTGDRLRTHALGRAMLYVQPETIVRVDQNTAIKLNKPTDEIAVEFLNSAVSADTANAQSCGAGYFITRFPKKFEVKTPHMNAAVEGTEFEVESNCTSTQLTVLEGKVSSESTATGDRQLVQAGQSISSGTRGVGPITAVIRPQDAVQWVLRYPPISDGSSASRAERLLRAGSIDDALTAIDSLLRADPDDSDALAVRSVIQVAKNDKRGALESATRAIRTGPENYRAWLALSYAQQTAFELNAALESARKAESIASGSPLAHARVAELYLSLGDSLQAEAAARAAIASNPAESHAHTVLGFVHLAQIDTSSARADFEAAIARDSFAALPRLGLGLAIIRDGELVEGREQLEIAVALDPSNSLLRSYVGKAYYEERSRNRIELAGMQFEIAKDLDPMDPTPWVYDAITLQSINRPVEAVKAFEKSIALNDNRAIYRSRLLLDSDYATRSAGLGGAYRDLGFEQLALIEGYQSLEADPGDYSSHRLLADHYDSLPKHEIARVNELFKSQLLQPLNTTPIPAQAGQASLFLNPTAGPSDVSINEFSQLFSRDQLRIQASGVVGGNDTIGNDATLAGIWNRFSFNLGQYHFETDGFRENNDSQQDIFNAFFQYALSDNSSALVEWRMTETEQGDLNLLFNPTQFIPSFRQDEKTDSVRLGLHHELSTKSELLVSLLYQDAEIATSLDPGLDFTDNFQGYTTELQHIYRADTWNLVSGFRYIDLDQRAIQTVPVFPQDPPFMDFVTTIQELAFEDITGYVYANIDLPAAWDLALGVAATSSKGRAFEAEQVNPKLGVSWAPSEQTTLRASAFRTLQPAAFSQSNIQPFLEPTEVKGFNQYFFGAEGEDAWRYGIAVDHQVSDNLAAGLELSRRNLETPIISIDQTEESFVVETDEVGGRAYVFWTPAQAENFAVRAEYRYDEQDNEELPEFGTTMNIRTHWASLGLDWRLANGIGLDLAGAYVDQRGDFLVFVPPPIFVQEISAGESFWTIDVSISYRLPKRYGIVTLAAKNLLDEEFNFQDIDPANPRIFPERMVQLKFTLDFTI